MTRLVMIKRKRITVTCNFKFSFEKLHKTAKILAIYIFIILNRTRNVKQERLQLPVDDSLVIGSKNEFVRTAYVE